MFKCILAINIVEDRDWWLFKTVQLPFKPAVDDVYTFAIDSAASIHDTVTLESVEWNHQSVYFYCEVVMEHGDFTPEQFEASLKRRGWREESPCD